MPNGIELQPLVPQRTNRDGAAHGRREYLLSRKIEFGRRVARTKAARNRGEVFLISVSELRLNDVRCLYQQVGRATGCMVLRLGLRKVESGNELERDSPKAGYKVSKQRKTVVFYMKSVAVQSGTVKSQAALSCT